MQWLSQESHTAGGGCLHAVRGHQRKVWLGLLNRCVAPSLTCCAVFQKHSILLVIVVSAADPAIAHCLPSTEQFCRVSTECCRKATWRQIFGHAKLCPVVHLSLFAVLLQVMCTYPFASPCTLSMHAFVCVIDLRCCALYNSPLHANHQIAEVSHIAQPVLHCHEVRSGRVHSEASRSKCCKGYGNSQKSGKCCSG